jgi:DnaJ-class molecular chaperone
MAAFDPSRGGGGMGGEPDIDDIFAQMFGGGMNFGGMPGMGGMGGMPGGPGGRQVPRKGRSVEQQYEVTLEELYKGKTTKFSNTKNVVCGTCKGSGGKANAKPHACSVCGGRGKTNPDIMLSDLILTFSRCQTGPSSSRAWSRHARDCCMLHLCRVRQALQR